MPKVTVLPANVSAEVEPGELLLEAGEKAGVEMEAGCFNCSCGTCAIEVVSGMPYETFLDKRLFGPLGMKDTTFWPSEAQIKRLAKSYKPNKDKTGLEETTVTALKYPLSDRQTSHGPPPRPRRHAAQQP